MAENDRAGLSRRALLAGLGAATGATVLATAAPAGAQASTDQEGEPKRVDQPLSVQTVEPTAVIDFKPELTYIMISPAAFTNDTHAGGRNISNSGASPADRTIGTASLSAPLVLPAGSRLREIVVSYSNSAVPPTDMWATVFRKSFVGPYGDPILQGKLTPLGSVPYSSVLLEADEPVTGDDVFEFSVTLPGANQWVGGLLVGYLPPTRSYVPQNPIPRSLDTRLVGGKLKPNEERVVALGVPAGVAGAVLNLTVSETEGVGGFVAVFPADAPYPGNSSINWFGPGQNLANTLVTGVDAGGQIRIRGGVAATHVIIDLLGVMS
jgi:hypothetical protein